MVKKIKAVSPAHHAQLTKEFLKEKKERKGGLENKCPKCGGTKFDSSWHKIQCCNCGYTHRGW